MKNERLIWIILGIVVLLFLFGGFGMMGYGTSVYGFGGMIGMMYGSYGTGMMFFGWLFGILFLILLVLLITWLFQQIIRK
jgi:uncharacterized membrane protein